MFFKTVGLLVFCVSITVSANAVSAQVILDDAFIGTGGVPIDQSFGLTKSIPVGNGLFSYTIERNGSNGFEFASMGIAEANSLFAAKLGEVISENFVSVDRQIVSNFDIGGGSGSETFIFQPGESRYFGYWDNQSSFGGIDNLDNFGWAEVVRVGDILAITQGATSIGSPIRVGSFTAIPEPASGTVGLFLLTAVGLKRRRQERQAKAR